MTTNKKENNEELEIVKQHAHDITLPDDELSKILSNIEWRVNAIKTIKQAAIGATNNRDWVDQNGMPYLMASGAEKIAGIFKISWELLGDAQYREEPDGHFTYTFRGVFRMGGRIIEAEGSRSSKDRFFRKYQYNEDGSRVELPVSEIDKRDVRMAAYTNLLGNGITRILGIRNLTFDDLEQFAGIKRDDLARIEYRKPKSSKPVTAPPQKKAPVSSQHKKPTEEPEPLSNVLADSGVTENRQGLASGARVSTSAHTYINQLIRLAGGLEKARVLIKNATGKELGRDSFDAEDAVKISIICDDITSQKTDM